MEHPPTPSPKQIKTQNNPLQNTSQNTGAEGMNFNS